jgi:hypothetical protein
LFEAHWLKGQVEQDETVGRLQIQAFLRCRVDDQKSASWDVLELAQNLRGREGIRFGELEYTFIWE